MTITVPNGAYTTGPVSLSTNSTTSIVIPVASPTLSVVPLKPAGYKILVKMYRAAEKSRGGLFIPQTTQADETVASMLCEVVELGPLCYKDPDKYYTGPWCKAGDIIIMKTYAGVRLQVGDDEYRLINDDSVDAVVTDVSKLSDITRAY